ncbi:MAG: type II CRISPR RNA-guided endonuclease Cas9 [Lachnospiraceae bacterium]|nr:type II CRISPR RNA-guided endonuclease Cas9 [Lachnospiraceae bacterium]
MSEKKKFGEYYLGLDIGTDSVGWAITDVDYNLLEFNRKAMWGIHLFKSGETAEDRRLHRCSRRRLQRRHQRIMLLREIFDEEISDIDPSFYSRLDESNCILEDRKEKQKNTLFNDPIFTDVEYLKKYPTIYHLRKDLMVTKSKPDIRSVYLAIHHILKYRGHFLFDGLSKDSNLPEFDELFNRLLNELYSECNIKFSVSEVLPNIKALFLSKDRTVSDKASELSSLMSAESVAEEAVCQLLAGRTVTLDRLFSDKIYKDLKVRFKGTSFEDSREELEDALGETYFGLLDSMKQIYDWSILKSMLEGFDYLSDAKIDEYEQHKKDLVILKAVLKAHSMKMRGDSSLYREVLKYNVPNNYCAYSGMVKGIKLDSQKTCSQEDFCKYLGSVLKDFDFTKDKFTQDMKKSIDEGTFMPKQTSKDNSVIPNDLHRRELVAILDNVSKFYPFLLETDSDGICVSEKILSLCTFRVPYYVGPLNGFSDRAWAIRKTTDHIYPWNFENVIDIDQSAIGFINKLISYCTYIIGERVLPKRSVLYARFELYNELNNLSINGERISAELKSSIVRDIFEIGKGKKVTVKDLKTYINIKYGEKDVEVMGIVDSVKSSISAELQVRRIVGDSCKNCILEEIISCITIFGDDRKRLKSKLSTDFGDKLSNEEINELSKLKFSKWGRLSEKFLTGIYHTWSDGSSMNIITALEQTNCNLMELLSKKYSYMSQIEKINDAIMPKTKDGKITCDIVKDLYCSPAVKRSICRTLSIIKDVLNITGHSPKKIFIETTRETSDNKKIPDSRKILLEGLYKKCLNANNELVKSLQGTDNARLRGKKIFSYYNQMGKCMYCGKKIDLNDLSNNEICDMDHIWPQSLVMDDSIHNNMVLTCRRCNQDKLATYPIKEDIQKEMHSFWNYLHSNKFMTDEKYKRLTRTSPFTDDERNSFIARQLVETSQSVKAVAKTLEKVFGKSSDIVYVKSGNVSRFRQENKFLKCRNVNDYHHAKDAYLNIVVGNVYDVKFTKNPLNFIKNNDKYNLGKMFDYDVSRDGVNAWIAGEDKTISTVKKYMRRNNILYTRYPYKESGQLYDATLMSKGLGQCPVKKNKSIETYGGYNKISGSYFSLVEHTCKGKVVRTLENVPIMDAFKLSSIEDMNSYFAFKGLINPNVRISCIRMDSVLSVNDFRVTISGRTGNNILYMCAEQLILSIDLYNYCKNLYKFAEAKKGNKEIFDAKDYGISAELNLNLYNELLSKIKVLYGKLSIYRSQLETLDKLYSKFKESAIEIQAGILSEILHIFQCNPVGMNLKALGGPSNAGRILLNKDIANMDSIKLINQSPSGLFEIQTDLKQI